MFLFDRPVRPETDHDRVIHRRYFEGITFLSSHCYFLEEDDLTPRQVWKILQSELGYHTKFHSFFSMTEKGNDFLLVFEILIPKSTFGLFLACSKMIIPE